MRCWTPTSKLPSTVGGAWLFGGLVQDVLGSEEFFFFDLATMRYLAANPVDGLITIGKVVNLVTDARVLVPAVGAVAFVAFLLKRKILAVALVGSVAGQWAIVELTETIVRRSPPAVVPLAARLDYGFPSEHVALVTAIAFVAAWAGQQTDWLATVRRYSIAITAIVITGGARIVLLVEYPSDTIAAAAIAATWTLMCCLIFYPRRASAAAAEPR